MEHGGDWELLNSKCAKGCRLQIIFWIIFFATQKNWQSWKVIVDFSIFLSFPAHFYSQMWWTSHFLQSSSLTTLVSAPEILQICSWPICHMVVSCVGFKLPLWRKGDAFSSISVMTSLFFFVAVSQSFRWGCDKFGGRFLDKPQHDRHDRPGQLEYQRAKWTHQSTILPQHFPPNKCVGLDMAWNWCGSVQKKSSTFPGFKINFT